MKLSNISKKVHKWLMLFIGAQFVIWSVTGAYMVFFDIDYIHGDSLVVTHQNTIKSENLTFTSSALYKRFPNAKNLSVDLLIDREVYRFNNRGQQIILDARTGDLLSPINKSLASAIAKHTYAGDDDIVSAELITENPPFELSARHLPVWQIDFDHFSSPSLYVSASTGEVVTKRHNFWRLFDWMFRFHIMEYGGASDVSNWLLFIISSLALIAALSGLVLTYFRVVRPFIFPQQKRDNRTKKTPRKVKLSTDKPS